MYAKTYVPLLFILLLHKTGGLFILQFEERKIFFTLGIAHTETRSGLPVKIFETNYTKRPKFCVLCEYPDGHRFVAKSATVFWVLDFLDNN